MSEVSWRQLVTLTLVARGPTQKVSHEHLDQVRERALGTSAGRAFQAEMQRCCFGIMKSLALKTARDQWWEWSKPGREQYKVKDIRAHPFHQAVLEDVFLPPSLLFFLWTERVGPLAEFPPRNDLIKCMIRKEGTKLREAIATIHMTLVQIQHGVEVAVEVVRGGILCLFEKNGGDKDLLKGRVWGMSEQAESKMDPRFGIRELKGQGCHVRR